MRLLVQIFVLSQIFTLKVNGSFEWVVTSPVQPPLIKAYINQTYQVGQKLIETQLSTETNDNANFTIRQNSALTVKCSAVYPVRWFKGNKEAIEQTLFAPSENALNMTSYLYSYKFYQNEVDYSNQSDFNILESQYEAILQFNNFTTIFTGNYTCESISKADNLTTTLDLLIDLSLAPPIKSIQPQILQTGFAQVKLPLKIYKTIFSFIYYLPANSQIQEYFILPNLRRVNSSQQSESDVIVKTVAIASYLRQGILTFPSREDEYGNPELPLSGSYQFVIESQTGNAAMIKYSYAFEFHLQEYSSQDIYNFADHQRTFMTIGQLYEISVGRTLSYMPLVAEMQTYGQLSNQTSDCAFYPASLEDCGVIGIGSYYNNRSNRFGINFRLVVNATKHCAFFLKVQTTCKQCGIEKSNLNISTIMDTDLSSDENENVILTASSGDNTGAIKEVNDTFSLRCSVPTCEYDLVGWCKVEAQMKCSVKNPYGSLIDPVESDVKNYGQSLSSDPSLKTSYYYVNNYTAVSTLTFLSLKPYHTGFYVCVRVKPWYRIKPMESLAMLFGQEFDLQVADPKSPTFDDGKQFLTEYLVIDRGGDLNLSCEVTGSPSPKVSWILQPEGDAVVYVNSTKENKPVRVKQAGTYKCLADNSYGSNFRSFVVQYRDNTPAMAIAIAVPVAIAVLALLITLILWLRRRAENAQFKDLLKESSKTIQVNRGQPLNYQTDILPYKRDYEISKDKFTLTKLIGQGEFGKVYQGEYKTNDSTILVAIKIPNNHTKIQHHIALLDELKIMIHIRPHVNVIGLIGACTLNLEKKQLFVLTEFCENRSLRDYLLGHYMDFENFVTGSDGFLKSMERLLRYAYQAANGMAHLAAENIIHRDLALRNILLNGQDIIKISDFGMSRQHSTIYKKRITSSSYVPMHWMAPEAIMDGEYSQKSDVWSFGVVLWEMFSCGRQPYAEHRHILKDAQDLISWLFRGNRLTQPRIASPEIYELMLDCWKKEPHDRPSFSGCKRRIAVDLEQRSPSNYASLSTTLNDAWHHVYSEHSPTRVTTFQLPQSTVQENSGNGSIIFSRYVSVEEAVREPTNNAKQPFPEPLVTGLNNELENEVPNDYSRLNDLEMKAINSLTSIDPVLMHTDTHTLFSTV